jgi:hypothetical protein
MNVLALRISDDFIIIYLNLAHGHTSCDQISTLATWDPRGLICSNAIQKSFLGRSPSDALVSATHGDSNVLRPSAKTTTAHNTSTDISLCLSATRHPQKRGPDDSDKPSAQLHRPFLVASSDPHYSSIVLQIASRSSPARTFLNHLRISLRRTSKIPPPCGGRCDDVSVNHCTAAVGNSKARYIQGDAWEDQAPLDNCVITIRMYCHWWLGRLASFPRHSMHRQPFARAL